MSFYVCVVLILMFLKPMWLTPNFLHFISCRWHTYISHITGINQSQNKTYWRLFFFFLIHCHVVLISLSLESIVLTFLEGLEILCSFFGIPAIVLPVQFNVHSYWSFKVIIWEAGAWDIYVNSKEGEHLLVQRKKKTNSLLIKNGL